MHDGIGIVVIGDEILSGRREDRHLGHVARVLEARGRRLWWARFEGDELEGLTATLTDTLGGDVPVVCFGGIGPTPDDRTREAAARAAGVELVRHPEAVAAIEARFGAAAWPTRARMADFPAGAEPIANPYNNIPGFRLRHHFFLPGFPVMAWPMLDSVLDGLFPEPATPVPQRALQVLDTPESELVDLLEALERDHPGVAVFSLPHLGERRYVELGCRGRGDVAAAFAALESALMRRGIATIPLSGT